MGLSTAAVGRQLRLRARARAAVAVGQALRARGVAVRPFPDLPHVGDTLRISVGPWPMLERLLEALDRR